MLASPQSIAQLADRGSMKIVGSACSNSPGEMKPQSLSAEEDFTEHIQIRLLKNSRGTCHRLGLSWTTARPHCSSRSRGAHTSRRIPLKKEYQISFIASFPRSRGSCASDFVRPSDECGEFCREPSLRC